MKTARDFLTELLKDIEEFPSHKDKIVAAYAALMELREQAIESKPVHVTRLTISQRKYLNHQDVERSIITA